MTIGVDLDDVLADTMGPLIRFHNDTYGTKLQREHFLSPRWWEVWGGTRDQSVNKFFEFTETLHFKDLQPLEEAIEAIDELSKKHELIVITSRQTEFITETKRWIKAHFPGKFRDIFVTNHAHWAKTGTSMTKLEVCQKENVDVLIEDNLEYAVECAIENTKVLLLDAPWNQGKLPKNVHRVFSWKEVVSHEVLN